jgi:hypothetical protein
MSENTLTFVLPLSCVFCALLQVFPEQMKILLTWLLIFSLPLPHQTTPNLYV